jgi:hypothetical protein
MSMSRSQIAGLAFACGVPIVLGGADAFATVRLGNPTFAPAWVGSSSVASGFGHSVASAGDVNGDGFADVVVGAPWFDGGQFFEGKAFAYHGSASGLSAAPNWSYENNVAFHTVGSEVAGVGDVNNDGYDDVVVGVEQYTNGQTNEGRALLFLGSPTGLSTTPSWVVESNDAFSRFGSAIAGAGDLDNDGFCDVVIGASESGLNGSASVYHGSPTGLPALATAVRTGPHANASFAYDVQYGGDVNGDGYDDIVFGVPGLSNGEASEGGALVYAGSASGIGAAPQWTIESNVANMWLGTAVGDGGDFNADGYADFALGAPYFGTDLWQEGQFQVFMGSSSGPGTSPAMTVSGGEVNGIFGSALANAGDVDADGYDDLLVGATSYDDAPFSFFVGRLFVHRGGVNGLDPLPSWSGGQANNLMFLGLSAAGAGDVNGDGFADVMGGGENFDSGAQHAQVFHGGAYAAIAPYGRSKALSPTVFSPRLVTTTAPAIGATSNLIVANGVKLAPGGFLFAGFQPLSVPFDEGMLNVVPTYVVILPAFDAQGKVTIPVAIPPLAGLDGLSVYFQAGQATFQAPGPHHTTQTNGLRWVLGN